MLIDQPQQTDKLLFDAPAKASARCQALPLPLGEVPEGRRGPSQSASLTAPPKGEPWALPRQFNKQQFARGNDTELPPKGVTAIASHRDALPVGASPQTPIYRFADGSDKHFSKKRLKKEK